MDSPQPIHLVTLALAVLAVGFSFVAMRAALEARDHAASAAGASTGDGSYQAVGELQNALVRAGVIEDPSVVPDDGGEPDGAEDVDRVARRADGPVVLHVRGQGWYEGELDEW